eukprot:XP_012817287.1 PREDICTED: uncharacterized protein LOC100496429 [Xenopus tropicalis]
MGTGTAKETEEESESEEEPGEHSHSKEEKSEEHKESEGHGQGINPFKLPVSDETEEESDETKDKKVVPFSGGKDEKECTEDLKKLDQVGQVEIFAKLVGSDGLN